MNPLAQYMENNSRLLYSIGSNEYGLQYVVTAISVCICCSSHSLSTAHWLQFFFFSSHESNVSATTGYEPTHRSNLTKHKRIFLFRFHRLTMARPHEAFTGSTRADNELQDEKLSNN